MTLVQIFFRTIVNIFWIVFIEWIIGQVDIAAIKIVIWWFVVLLGSEPSETFMIDIQPQRICPCHKYIDSQIKFKLINKKWILYVLLDHIFIPIKNIFNITSEKYPSALR